MGSHHLVLSLGYSVGNDKEGRGGYLTTHFEAIKVSQNKEKNYITFSVHPDDVDNLIEFYKDRVGSRYMVAVAAIGDNEEVVPVMDKTEGQKAYQSFSSLCRNEKFQTWLHEGGFSAGVSEEEAVKGVKNYISVDSRSELLDNTEARRRFVGLRNVFWESLKRR